MPRWAPAFLNVLALNPNIRAAARASGIGRQTAYDARASNVVFAECWEQALDEAVERLEAEAHRRAFEGVEEPVHYKGDRVDTVLKYSDTLAIFLLKAHRPERYRERQEMHIKGALNLAGAMRDMSDEELGRLAHATGDEVPQGKQEPTA